MEFASLEKTVLGIIAFAIVIGVFYFFDYLAKRYDKKHPDAPHASGHYMTPKAGYSFSKGEKIFHLTYIFVVCPILLIAILLIWEKISK